SPSECRDAPYSQTCNSYRIELKRDKNPDALNFVYFTLAFAPVAATPDLAFVVAGYPAVSVGDLDVHVWDEDDHYLGENYPGGGGDIGFALDTLAQTPAAPAEPPLRDLLLGTDPGDPTDEPPGGAGLDVPEHGGFTAKQDVYDIVITTGAGFNQGYTLTLTFSNELFSKPSELLGAPLGPITPPADNGSFETPPFTTDSGSVVEPLVDLSVLPDSDIAGIGSGINEQFNSKLLTAIGKTRPISANAKPPSTIALIAAMLALPVFAGGGGVWLLRRKRRALLT
ncbi:MAG: hypothetical protein QOF21_2759, partial [Actinomycetota bacterium]